MRAQPSASHYIDGVPHETPDGAILESRYPATNEVIARLHAAGPETVNAAVAAARAGQKIWAATPLAERGRVLRRAAELMRARNRELSELETLDTGKPLQETLVADAASGADCLEYFGSLAPTLTGEHIDLGGAFAYTRREPLGVVGAIGAWNYPIQIACWKVAPALACGNAMVFKPSELTPLSALKLAEILTEAGLPAGVFNVVQGHGDTGAHLVAHPDVAKVSLTGSVPTGIKVAQTAADTLKHVTLELGGKSPLIVFDDADLDNAVSAAINANFYSSGQICSNGTRVFVQRDLKEAFLARLAERTARARLGDPLDDTVDTGPLVSRGQLDKVMGYIEKGRAEGARLVCGGTRAQVPGLPDGLFVAPTVFADVADHMAIAREEIFGPVMCVLDFDTEEEAVARANATDFGLAAGVFTRDLARAHRVIAALHAGTCWINTYNLTPVEMPFGGVKKSGIGRENGHAAIEHYSQVKSVYVELGDVESAY
ncbi:betaine-aldehyde dehydrogenase [Stappia sp.]|uniref:betaine-aldehyde dehydrogenase n=1 Tax=Stappia sp. TaxID=1870903 RepID=UPI0032D8D360